jgi:excisionase family DNA binding protein
MESGVIRKALSVQMAAEMLGISRSMVHKLIRLGKLKSFKAGTRTLLTPSDVDEFIEKNSRVHSIPVN